MPKWEAAAREALELDENLANAHFAIGQFKRDVWRVAGSRARIQESHRVEPEPCQSPRRILPSS